MLSNSELNTILNSNCTVLEKLEMIEAYKVKSLQEIDIAISKVKEGYVYCQDCKQWYRENAWDNKQSTEQRKYCSFVPLAEWDEPEYETGLFLVDYIICPLGHKHELKSRQI